MEDYDEHVQVLDGDEDICLSTQLTSASTPASASTPIQSPNYLLSSSQDSAEQNSESSGPLSSGRVYMYFQ